METIWCAKSHIILCGAYQFRWHI